MTKEEYIEYSILKLLHNWTNFALLSGTIIVLGLSILDLAVTSENLGTFLIYRFITASILLLTHLFNKRRTSWRHLHISGLIASISVSTMVALMIAKYGGHTSHYYGGIIIILIFVITVSPTMKKWEALPAIFYATLIYCIFVIPIIIYDTIINWAFFINANFFIIASAVSLIFIRHFIIKRFRNEFSLQYEMEQREKELSLYSELLKKEVTKKEAALETSETKFKELFENANDGIAVMNMNGIIIGINNRFLEITGFDRDSLIGTNIKILEVGGDKEENIIRRERVLKGEPVIFEMEHFRKDGEKIELEVSSKAINIDGEVYIQSFYRDITEKKRLQAQLFQAQKMESIGILAGSIAHDFDNIITSITGNIEMLKNNINLDKWVRQRVSLIENSTQRAKNLIARLLSFARKSHYQKRIINLNKVIEETIELMKTTLTKKGIEVDMCLNEDASAVTGDGNMLSQVIMNLAINAIDAMPFGGKLDISTSIYRSKGQEEVGAYRHMPLLLKTGNYVEFKLSDTGKGIPHNIKDRIFEPFFTTKREGQGTGLGLSIVYRIVKEHGGDITVDSFPGKGTTFKIYLPLAECHQSFQRGQQGQRILIVDDEIEMLNFVKDLLESRGYSVITMNDPLQVHKMDQEMINEIDLLITDIMMPHINGKELIRYFKSVKPSIKVIAISAHDIWNIGKRDSDINAFVGKPFEAIYLLSVVKRIIESQDLLVNTE